MIPEDNVKLNFLLNDWSGVLTGLSQAEDLLKGSHLQLAELVEKGALLASNPEAMTTEWPFGCHLLGKPDF